MSTLKKQKKQKLTLSSGKMGLPLSLLVIYLSIWYSVWGIIDSTEIWQMNSWITIKNICEYYWPWQTRRYLNLFYIFFFVYSILHFSWNVSKCKYPRIYPSWDCWGFWICDSSFLGNSQFLFQLLLSLPVPSPTVCLEFWLGSCHTV